MLGNFTNSPPRWTNVFPQGTPEGDEESRFFKALARHKKYEWRSLAAIRKESKLTAERIEQIIQKYHRRAPGMIVNSPTTPDNWGYWERVKNSQKKHSSLTRKDQKSRIDKADPQTMGGNAIGGNP